MRTSSANYLGPAPIILAHDLHIWPFNAEPLAAIPGFLRVVSCQTQYGIGGRPNPNAEFPNLDPPSGHPSQWENVNGHKEIFNIDFLL